MLYIEIEKENFSRSTFHNPEDKVFVLPKIYGAGDLLIRVIDGIYLYSSGDGLKPASIPKNLGDWIVAQLNKAAERETSIAFKQETQGGSSGD